MNARPHRGRTCLEAHADEFEAVFLSVSGIELQMRWAGLPAIVGEIGRPVRMFGSYRGQRNYPGWYWAATTGRRIGFESWVERDHLVALDSDPDVVDMVSQPFWLLWREEPGKQRRHAPDFLVRMTGDRWLVLDSRPLDLIRDRDKAAFAATARACAQVGWTYAVWDRMDPILAANNR